MISPGPWKYRKPTRNILPVIFDATGDLVATMKRVHNEEDFVVMAAAPELLDACRTLLAIVVTQNGNIHHEINELVASVRATLAKAGAA